MKTGLSEIGNKFDYKFKKEKNWKGVTGGENWYKQKEGLI